MNTRNTMALAAGIVIAILVVALIISYYVAELIDHWDAQRNPPGPDVGAEIFDGPETCCETGCYECGAPMVVDEEDLARQAAAAREAWDRLNLAAYGGWFIHRHCLDARRDGGRPCYQCAPVLAGVA